MSLLLIAAAQHVKGNMEVQGRENKGGQSKQQDKQIFFFFQEKALFRALSAS